MYIAFNNNMLYYFTQSINQVAVIVLKINDTIFNVMSILACFILLDVLILLRMAINHLTYNNIQVFNLLDKINIHSGQSCKRLWPMQVLSIHKELSLFTVVRCKHFSIGSRIRKSHFVLGDQNTRVKVRPAERGIVHYLEFEILDLET